MGRVAILLTIEIGEKGFLVRVHFIACGLANGRDETISLLHTYNPRWGGSRWVGSEKSIINRSTQYS